MTKAVVPLVFPNGRVLAAWWPRLAPLQPSALWVDHLFLHHVEALVRTTLTTPMERLPRLVLRALALGGPTQARNLGSELHLPQDMASRVLHMLQADGLSQKDASCHWSLTEAGCRALERGDHPRPTYERRRFHFLERRTGSRTPHYVRLSGAPTVARQNPGSVAFEANWLKDAVAQSSEWKTRHEFPADVETLITSEMTEASAGPVWRRVIVDRQEQVLLLLALHHDGNQERLLGFGIDPTTWALRPGEPSLTLGKEWRETFPDLTPVSDDDWRAAWLSWCQARGVPTEEHVGETLRLDGAVLHLTTSPSLLERLRESPHDPRRHETWLFAGDGDARAAARLEVSPNS